MVAKREKEKLRNAVHQLVIAVEECWSVAGKKEDGKRDVLGVAMVGIIRRLNEAISDVSDVSGIDPRPTPQEA